MKYLYESNGVVKVYPEKKPEVPIPAEDKNLKLYRIKCRSYHKVLKKWSANGKIVENAHESEHSMEGYPEILVSKPVFQIVTPGQQVETKPSGENVIVTKIY